MDVIAFILDHGQSATVTLATAPHAGCPPNTECTNLSGFSEELWMRMALRDLRHDLSRPAGLELVVYGSWWIGHCQLSR